MNLSLHQFLIMLGGNNEFCTISPYIDGDELPNCTKKQIRGIGVNGLKNYFENNIKLARFYLWPDYYAFNFKLSPQGNINVVDYFTWYLIADLNAKRSIGEYGYRPSDMEEINERSCHMLMRVSDFDNKILGNLYNALEQMPNTKFARRLFEQNPENEPVCEGLSIL